MHARIQQAAVPQGDCRRQRRRRAWAASLPPVRRPRPRPRPPPPTSARRLGGSERRSRDGGSQRAPTGTFNWMTWGDHWYQAQVDAIAATNNIKTNATLFSDNIDAYTKVKQVGGQLDMVSGDALWVPHYFESGLIEAWDINSLKVAIAALLDRPVVPDLDEAGRLPRLPLRVVAGPDLLRPGEGLPGARFRGRSSSTRSTRGGSSWRISRSRSWPTWGSSPAWGMRTA